MLRYRLDDLGAFQFEWLVQSLLKIIIGPGVESWGGRGDHGRDSFSLGPLNFPDRSARSLGPFVFQAKFVENANAAGATPLEALKDAIKKEKAKILHRMKLGSWKHPRHYVLITNALLTPEFRRWAQQSLTKVLGEKNYHFLSGGDICDFLDQEPAIRQSFPQVLGLRDLTELIQDAVNKKEIERSRSAIDSAIEIAPVFVPTRAYNKTWKVLSEHNFVVLEGPPEMGKSAIAWMIALAQVSNGWQGIYCNDPDTFFSQYDSSQRQVFVADDAFGLTEYDPTRSQKWEKELALVTRRLDPKHWLIWTSRKHILERALQKLDFKRDSPDFPEPAAVMVNAEELSVVEKALILYRHAKKASLSATLRAVIRKSARNIVGSVNFTPERIRKLAREVLPKYCGTEPLPEDIVAILQKEIREAIANPTERIKTTFRALPASHKWALIAMLEVGGGAYLNRTAESYGRLCPEEDQEPFADVLDQLTESFIKRSSTTDLFSSSEELTEILTWIHPSYRDLVIDELAREASLSNRFLSSTTLPGIKLAISSGGGERGERELPFLTSDRAWQLLSDTCQNLAATVDIRELPEFLEALSSATVEAAAGQEHRLQEMTKDICDIARRRWDDSQTILTSEELEAYDKASLLVSPLPPIPKLQASWDAATAKFVEEIQESKDLGYFFPDEITSFVKLVRIIEKIEPRFLRQKNFEEKYRSHLDQVFELVQSELKAELSDDEPDNLRSDAYRYKSLIDLVSDVSKIMPGFRKRGVLLIPKLADKAAEADTAADDLEVPEPDYDTESLPPSDDRVDVDLLFSDL
jgi:conflict system STAND superfamily ATPase